MTKSTSLSLKPSGVPWLGDIPAGWGVLFLVQLADQVKNRNTDLSETNLLSLSYGKIKRKDIDSPDGLLPASFDGYNIIEKGDVVLRLTDLQNDQTSLRVGRSEERGIITSAYTTVHPRNADFAPYLFYALNAFDLAKGFYGMGSGVRQGLNWSEVKRLQIPFPPLPEQRAIADFLDERCAAIDAIVEEAKAGIEEYAKWKQSVVFEAVAKGLSPHAKMKDSGVEWIGEIPEGWKVCKTLFALQMPITDGPHTTPELFAEGVPFVSAEAVTAGNGTIDFSHIRGYISEEFYQECCLKYIPRIDDIFMIKSGATTGRVAIVDTDRKFTIWSPLAVFRANPQRVLPRFLFYFLQSDLYQKQVSLAWNFGTQQNIGMRALERLMLLLPPLPEQRAIAAYLDEKCSSIDALIEEKKNLIEDLGTYKKSLIYETVTGKRRVG